MSERDVTADQVREEHLSGVDARAHWAYLVVVLAGGMVVMLALIAILDGLG
jgi:hypothetical protein